MKSKSRKMTRYMTFILVMACTILLPCVQTALAQGIGFTHVPSAVTVAGTNAVLPVLARMPQHLDVFWTAPDSSLMTNWWNRWTNLAQWNTPFRVWPP